MTGTKDAVVRLSPGRRVSDDVVRALQAASTPGPRRCASSLGLHKVAPTLLWVQERMASTRKLLIFAWHHTVIEDLRKGLVEFNPVVITGATSPKDRAEAIDQFQNHPNVRVFIGQVLAAGTA